MDIRKYFGVSTNNNDIKSNFFPESPDKLGNKSPDKSNEEYLAIYTDGSTFNNGSKKKKVYGGIGVFFGPDDHRNISQSITLADFPPNMDLQVSNNTCELLAVIRGIEKLMFSLGESHLIKMRNMRVYSDSEYLINSITKWYKGCEKNGWKRSDKKTPVKNTFLIKKLKGYVDKFNVKLIHVRAHKNPPDVDLDHKLYKIWYGNKMADKLAREGSKKSMEATD